MDMRSINTCLSDKVQNILSIFMSSDVTTVNCLDENKLMNWKSLSSVLTAGSMCSENNCISLRQCIAYVKSVYDSMSDEDLKRMEYALSWTSKEKIFLHCHRLLRDDSNECNTILALLLITAYLERALGNVYLLKGRRVPHLMKDLLATEELRSVLGHESVSVLQILMDSPETLNLRNLLWHGFLKPNELDNRFGHFLLAWAIGIGTNLPVATCAIPARKQAKLTWPSRYCFGVEELDVRKLKEIFSQSTVVLPQMLPYWEFSLCLFTGQRYGESLVLMLPQLETCLRCVFVSVNNCSNRLLTAETTSFYTTFDEMLAASISNGEPNRIRTILGDPFLEMYLDVLMYPDGPRVRDRVSHGEVDVDDVPSGIVAHMLLLAAATCVLFLQNGSPLLEDDSVRQLKKSIAAYKSLFHPSALLKNQILSLASSVDNWYACPRPPSDALPPLDTLESTSFSSPLTGFPDIRQTYKEESLETITKMVENFYPLTTFRPRSEGEIVTILHQIVGHSHEVSVNVATALWTRYDQWHNRNLKSRQRLNYRRLLSSTESIMLGLKRVLRILAVYFLNLNGESSVRTTRFLRRVLQYTENLSTLTDLTHNRWKESCELTADFLCLLNEGQDQI